MSGSSTCAPSVQDGGDDDRGGDRRGRSEKCREGADGEFRATEIAGLSELGLVGDLPAMADSLAGLGLEVWDGSVDPPGGLAFVGERARTLILAPLGRGWLPTGRIAEVYDVDVLLSGAPWRQVLLECERYRVRRSGS